MASPVDVCNEALGLIGEQRIGSLDDDNTRARHCKTFYQPTLKRALRFANWAFAREQAELAQIAEAPLFNFTFSYRLPDDYIMIRSYMGDLTNTTGTDSEGNQYVQNWPFYGHRRYPYKVYSDRRLYSYDAKAFIVYTKLVESSTEWDSMFEESLVKKMASNLANAISKDTEKGVAFATEAFDLLVDAASVSGQEGSVDTFLAQDLVDVR